VTAIIKALPLPGWLEHKEVRMATPVRNITPPVRLKIEKIAVLTDFSKTAEMALRYAATFARTYRATLMLAHAYLPPYFAYAAPEAALTYQALDDIRQSLQARMISETEAMYLKGLKCDTLLREGSPTDLMEDLKGADLIVVGTSGETGLSKAALGSVAETIFRSSATPVMTVGPHCRSSGAQEAIVARVLYATDFSPGAEIALPYAVSVALEHDAQLILLHVARGKDAHYTYKRAAEREKASKILNQLVPASTGLKYDAKYIVGRGAPHEVIVEEATEHRADLIVMGARGAGAFASAVSHFGGGTAYKVAVNADCPVLTIRKA
jgi:nucleotide-binding universal stress UspA family protein